ncbi:MAG: hypothetical protein LBJ14_02685 [Desulfarculales bacterium]|jgi:hypothetical protein|nr:hypothetical protein [Desulfarculales bacterium]
MSFPAPLRRLLWLAVLSVILPGCGSDPPPSWQEEKAGLTRRLSAFQRYYDRIQCVNEALDALELADNCLDFGTTLENYRLKITFAQTLLQNLACDEESKTALSRILSYHQLAERIWQARQQAGAGHLAADFIDAVWPLWRQFDYPVPEGLGPDISKNLDQYPEASGPQARQTLKQISTALDSPLIFPSLAAGANQVLWHQAHAELIHFKRRLWEGKDLLEPVDDKLAQ